MDEFDKALLIIAAVRAALKNNCRHFDKHGRELKTEGEIIEAMSDGITVDDSERVDNTTAYGELDAVKRQYRRH